MTIGEGAFVVKHDLSFFCYQDKDGMAEHFEMKKKW